MVYSTVLMLALTAGSEAVDRGGRGGCGSSCGSSCYSCAPSCYSCAPTCYGGSCGVPGGGPVLKKAEIAAPATILVSIPENARLLVDGSATRSTSERRSLITPTLEVGSTYVYTLRAEITTDGQTRTETREVTVRAGETSTVQFNLSSPGVASR
jgi:uncharacterized protein (TIGR03000 family)